MTLDQVKSILSVLNKDVPSIISVFAGRIADTGRDPIPLMTNCLKKIYYTKIYFRFKHTKKTLI